MCETVPVLFGFWNMAMVWQPMPASAREPAITLVERLCGQPEQKLGLRCGADGAFGPGSVMGCRPQSGESISTTSSMTLATMAGEISALFGNTRVPRSSA